MKLDASTINVLKNFADINASLFVKQGNVLKTISPSKTIMATSTVSVSFERSFAIFDLKRFLATLSLFEDPELSFNERSVTISSDSRKVSYTYADESVIMKAPDKELVLPSVDVEFKLTKENLRSIEKALGILGLPEFVVVGDGKTITLNAADTKNPSGDVYSINIGETDKVFKVIFKIENLKIIPDDYDVKVCSKGFSSFKGEKVDYFISVEATSTFG